MATLPELADLHDATHGDYERLHFQGRVYTSLELSGTLAGDEPEADGRHRRSETAPKGGGSWWSPER